MPRLLPTTHKQLLLKRSLATHCNPFVELSIFTSESQMKSEISCFVYRCCRHLKLECILILEPQNMQLQCFPVWLCCSCHPHTLLLCYICKSFSSRFDCMLLSILVRDGERGNQQEGSSSQIDLLCK